MEGMISPHDLIRELQLEGLNQKSDEYFQKLPDPLLQMGKPFTMPGNLPHTLEGLALVFRGLRLAPGMTVVDFGAGTCWLTRLLAQMGCEPVAVDVSASALQMGQRLFEEFPPCGPAVGHPRYVVYDGRTIPLPDASVDRIICFDAFHHVPNPQEVLAEFYRILRPHGQVGFHEPGVGHSRTEESQKEMRDFQVLESDVDKHDLFALWKANGPGDFRTIAHAGLEIELDEQELRAALEEPGAAHALLQRVLDVNRQDNIFFLSKGTWMPDSRSREGLRARITPPAAQQSPESRVEVTVENVGSSLWLAGDTGAKGEVRLGVRLRNADGSMLNPDFMHLPLPHELAPGASAGVAVPLSGLPEPGPWTLEFDMVAEHVCWFAELGSPTASVQIAAPPKA